MAFSWILLRIITNNQETEPQSPENSVLGLWQNGVMYTHKRPEALQALLGCWDKEVNNYWAPLTVLDPVMCISSSGSLQRALGPRGGGGGDAVFQIREPEAQRGEWFMPRFPSMEAHWNHLGSLFRIPRFLFSRSEVGLWQEYIFKTSEALPMYTFCWLRTTAVLALSLPD